MSLIKIKTVKTLVVKLLTHNPVLRDNDDLLTLQVRLEKLTDDHERRILKKAYEICKTRKLPSPTSVSRARRKAQEDFPPLRGKTYGGRKEEEEVVRKGIRDI
jgi:hypothetical protein